MKVGMMKPKMLLQIMNTDHVLVILVYTTIGLLGVALSPTQEGDDAAGEVPPCRVLLLQGTVSPIH